MEHEPVSQPAKTKELSGLYGYRKSAGLTSVILHVLVVTLLFTISTTPTARKIVADSVRLVAPDLAAYVSRRPGGGGDGSPLPAGRGRLPRLAPRQFTPPMAVVNNPEPKLIMEPTLVMPVETALPSVLMERYGDPLAPLGPPSNGRGRGGGIGNGDDGGVGDSSGPGYGGPPGEGAFGRPVVRAGGQTSQPVLIYKQDPDYSDEARKAKHQGTVRLTVEVNERGLVQNPRVLQPLGLGLDEKAIEAVLKWRFRPAMRDGKPVTVTVLVDAFFRLL